MDSDPVADRLGGIGQRGWWFIRVIGVVHIGGYLWYLSVIQAQSVSLAFGLELLLGLVGPIGLLYLSRRGQQRVHDDTYVTTAVSRFVAAYLGFGLIAGLLLVNRILKGYVVETPFTILYLATTTGGLAGLLIGIKEAEVRSRITQLEESRDAFAFLNSLLRHNVLNSIQIIDGYAELIGEDHAATEKTEAIHEQSAVIKETIQNVRVMNEALSSTVEFEAIDVVAILDDQIERSRTVYDATFESSLPEQAVVRADPLLAAAIQNLLDNAVTHNDSDQPMVTATVFVTDDEVTIEIADNGPGIDDDRKDQLFKREDGRGDKGLGLYLVKTLLERYDGTVTIEDNEPRGSVFVCRLPRANQPKGTSIDPVASVTPAREMSE
ncbi:MAG: ATP-binding protein [Halobacteriales archaeon]